MSSVEMDELRDTMLAWIDRRKRGEQDNVAICAIDSYREMVRQIEGQLGRTHPVKTAGASRQEG